MKALLRRRDWLKLLGGAAAGTALAGCVSVEVEEKKEDEAKKGEKPAPAEDKPPEATPAEAKPAADKDMRIYVCGKCGYVYDPSKQTPPTPFPDLPDTWTCPKCKSPKSVYKPKA